MSDVGGTTNTYEAQSRNVINICNKYGFDIFLVVMVDTDDTRRTTDERQGTAPGVWHKLPKRELKIYRPLTEWGSQGVFKIILLYMCI